MTYTYHVEHDAVVTVVTTITSDTPLDAGDIIDMFPVNQYTPGTSVLHSQTDIITATDGISAISGDLECEDFR